MEIVMHFVHLFLSAIFISVSISGKSTLGLLLARLYNLDTGKISFNGDNIEDSDPAIIRDQIGVVSQEPLLFDGTIQENIRYGRPDASDEEVRIISFI